MRSRTLLPALVVGLVAGLSSVSAQATPLCEDDKGVERAEKRDGGGASTEAETALGGHPHAMGGAELASAAAVEELILPCAMVESDQLGPWCVDAAVYLVTTSGTLLCRVSLPAVDLTTSSSPDLEDHDPAPMPQRAPLQAPAGSLASALKDAAKPLVLERASLPDRARLPPSPVYAEPPFVPG